MVLVDPSIHVPIRDPKDVVVLQTAIAAGADVICSLDTDFSDPETGTYSAMAGIEVLTDVELRRRIELYSSIKVPREFWACPQHEIVSMTKSHLQN